MARPPHPTAFGATWQVGVIEDRDNKDALLKLASFSSSADEDDSTLPDYVSRMKADQKQIYYLSGASKAAASASPVLERLQKQGYEVLFALDQIDEIALQVHALHSSPQLSPNLQISLP